MRTWRIVTVLAEGESSFSSLQSDFNHSFWFGQTKDIFISRDFWILPEVKMKDTNILSKEHDAEAMEV